jgi:hypothetical protein
MPRNIVKGLQVPVNQAFFLTTKFIEVCPEAIWADKSGGWPVWQQIYHALVTVDLFIGLPDSVASPPLAEAAVRNLEKVSGTILPKAAVQEVCSSVKARLDQFFKNLTDADLPRLNERLFANLKLELNMAGTIGTLAAHTFYHLGSGDSALRNQGLQGVF